MELKKLLAMSVTLAVLSSCSSDTYNLCVPTYRISKVPKIVVVTNSKGGMNKENTDKALLLTSQLRYVEDYYYINSTEVK